MIPPSLDDVADKWPDFKSFKERLEQSVGSRNARAMWIKTMRYYRRLGFKDWQLVQASRAHLEGMLLATLG